MEQTLQAKQKKKKKGKEEDISVFWGPWEVRKQHFFLRTNNVQLLPSSPTRRSSRQTKLLVLENVLWQQRGTWPFTDEASKGIVARKCFQIQLYATA